ncbi:MAG TPA: hypothetical protein VHY37_06580 [Tepidisphaeraceae bacterium]|jgi:Tfp pilus assembly protein PilF|nr:hypothetical protein [Tepidisphaeraceae bacterium]
MNTNHLRGAVLAMGAIAWSAWAGWAQAADPHDALIANRAAVAAKAHPGLADYFSAAEALEAGQTDACVAGLDKAIAADGRRPLYHLAKGVVLVLAGRGADAAADLNAANAADEGGCLLVGTQGQREAMMWTAVINHTGGQIVQGGPVGRINPRQFTFMPNIPYEDQVQRWIHSGAKQSGPEYTELAHHFAERLLTAPDVLPMRLKEADDLIAAGKADAALRILHQLSVALGDDPAWLSLDADAQLATGHCGTARMEYDKLLMREADNASAYLGHALASAHIGAIAREKDDLADAALLDPAAAAQFQQQHVAELQSLENSMPKADIKTLTQQFIDAAKAGEDDQKLARRALVLRYAFNGIRRVPQEKYIDGVRRRLNAIRTNPKDAAGWADLATFIYLEATNKYGQGKSDGIEWESDRIDAMFYANKALSLDPNNIEAIATKGWLLEQDNQEKDALTMAQNGLQIVPGYPRLANLQNELLQVSSLRAQQQAANLRSVKSGMIFTPDAIITWTRPPSQAELDAAKGYDSMSAANVATADHALLTGWRQFSDSVEQMDVIADYLDYHGQQPDAINLYKKILSLDPGNETALMQLEDIYKDNKQVDDAFALQFRLDNIFATSASAMIDKAASDDQAQNAAAVKQDLDQALEADPSDARVYVGFAHFFATSDPATWDAYVRCAIAMSEAQALVNGESFATGAPGDLAPNDAKIMTMLLQNRAKFLRQNNRAAEADVLTKNLADIQRRVALNRTFEGAQDSGAAFQIARLQWEKQLIANNEMADAARFCLQIPNREGQWHTEVSGEAYQIEYPVYRYLSQRLYHYQLWHFWGPNTLEGYEQWVQQRPNSTDTGVPPPANNSGNFAQ